MEKSLAALEKESGTAMRHLLQEEVELLEATLAELVEDQSPQGQIEAVQRNLARAQKDLEESSGIVHQEEISRNNLVSIIDVNEGQLLEELIGPEPGIIGVFGGTPRYSFYENYRQTLQVCSCELINQCEERIKRAHCTNPFRHLRGVERRIRKLLADPGKRVGLSECPGLRAFRDDLTTLSEAEMMHLFFAAGFDHELLARNIGTLLHVAQESHGSLSRLDIH